MAAAKYLEHDGAGNVREKAGVTTATADAIPALDATGRISNAQMPVGIGADTADITTSEALAAGDFVNIWNSSGAKARKADASGANASKVAHGFVLAAAASGATATVYFEGRNTSVSGQTPGPVFLLATAGTVGATAPTTAGHSVQRVGVAISATEVNFEPEAPVILA
jgi:hypothetical protein